MAAEANIVSYINSQLQSSQFGDKRFQKGDWNGIAILIPRPKGEEDQTIPAIVTETAVDERLGFDDTYPFRVYHRVLDYSFIEDDENSLGDQVSRKETSVMRMIIMGDTSRLGLTAEQIRTGVAVGFPLEIPEATISTYGITGLEAAILPGDWNVNYSEVWQQEFGVDRVGLRTTHFMMSFDYTIETFLNTGCYTLCEQ